MKEAIHTVLNATLAGQVYEPEYVGDWSKEISDSIKAKIKELGYDRYKVESFIKTEIAHLINQYFNLPDRGGGGDRRAAWRRCADGDALSLGLGHGQLRLRRLHERLPLLLRRRIRNLLLLVDGQQFTMEELFWSVKPLGNVASVSRRVKRVADKIVGLAEGDVGGDRDGEAMALNQINDFTSEKVKAEAAAFAETRRYWNQCKVSFICNSDLLRLRWLIKTD